MTDWRPDWQKEAAYAFTEELSLRGWAWQFVRRNRDYWQAWAEEEDCLRRSHELFSSKVDLTQDLGTTGFRKQVWIERWGFYLPTHYRENDPPLWFVGRSGTRLPPAELPTGRCSRGH